MSIYTCSLNVLLEVPRLPGFVEGAWGAIGDNSVSSLLTLLSPRPASDLNLDSTHVTCNKAMYQRCPGLAEYARGIGKRLITIDTTVI